MAGNGTARPRAPPFIDPPGYERHRPEATLLYQLVERHYAEFVAAREASGCGGRLKVIASIEEPELIERILAHRRERGEEEASASPLGPRAPPQASLS
jgi:hypothetical protein